MAGWRQCCRLEGSKAVDNERTLRVLASHFTDVQRACGVLDEQLVVLYYQRAADILTTKYINSSLDWDTYQMSLSALRAAMGILPPSKDHDRADGTCADGGDRAPGGR